MADNYLEKRMEQWRSQPSAKPAQPHASLERLLRRNRSCRGYDPTFVVREDQLRRIAAVNRLTPSARNQQVLRFRLVAADEAHKVLPHIRMGGALPELHLPYAGTEPQAFIVICTTVEPDPFVYMDLGISAQSMLLQAAEIGLNGLCIGAFDREALCRELQLELRPLLVVALGRGIEQFELVDIGAAESHAYYRDETGRHFVPKLRLEELLLG